MVMRELITDIGASEYSEKRISILPYPDGIKIAGKVESLNEISVVGRIDHYSIDLNSYNSSPQSQPYNSSPQSQPYKSSLKTAEYDQIKNKLLNAGFLVTSTPIFEDEISRILSPEEIAKVGKLPPDAPTILEMLNEDRGEY
ncbi:MAG: hypothetical protein Q9P01_02010 [Anaerolineae bacterium]|nr:hypothetical protein [Anaerolineae bacterium]MDQ7033634.1 hypothetical protein [Anaerolineae bacterium]